MMVIVGFHLDPSVVGGGKLVDYTLRCGGVLENGISEKQLAVVQGSTLELLDQALERKAQG